MANYVCVYFNKTVGSAAEPMPDPSIKSLKEISLVNIADEVAVPRLMLWL